jgi:hypothetical protein
MSGPTGITTNTVKRFFVDAGAVYLNYGLENERLLGATKGGNTFTIEQEIREMEADGARGPMKGARRIIRSVARCVANLVEITADNILVMLPGATKEDYPSAEAKTHDKITRVRDIQDGDYINNVALVGRISGADENFIGIVENVLADGNISANAVDKDEAAVEVQFTAHFDPAAMDEEPWEIRQPVIIEGS